MSQEDTEKKYYVYMYTSPSGKHYVGRTCRTKDLRAKANGRGYEACTSFWRAIKKYGWENFEYQVLEDGISTEKIDEREKYWIDYYQSSTDQNGYNLLKPNGTSLTFSEEVRKKLSESHLGHEPWNKGKTNVYSDEALQRMSQAHIGKGIPRKHPMSEETKKKISKSLTGKYAGKNHPMYGTHLGEETKRKLSESMRGRFAGEKNPMYGVHLTVSEETKAKVSEACSVPVMQFDLDGNYIKTFKSRTAAAKEIGIRETTVSACCNGDLKSAGGYQWCNVGEEDKITKYFSKNEKVKVAQIIDGKIINIFPSITSASRSINMSRGAIHRCLSGKNKTAGGYCWKRLKEVDGKMIDVYYSSGLKLVKEGD